MSCFDRKSHWPFSIVLDLAVILVSLVLFAGAHIRSTLAAPDAATNAKWTVSLPADLCPGTNYTDCHFGSPVIARIDGDAYPDIVAVTNKGHVVALRHNGTRLWDTDVAPYFGMSPGTHEIHSSPAVADIDGDGYPEIVVGTGAISDSVCTQGGLIVLNHNGKVEPGWPFLSNHGDIPPDGCRDSVVASPALGDLDNNGDLEVVAASFDKRIYALHHNGTLVNGFPPSSYHLNRFPDWDDFVGRLGDLTWASPALADLDLDGYLDVIISTGEGNYDARWGGNAGGWTCPYALPSGWAPGYCGGSLYAWDRFGNEMPGFPRYFLEAMGSTPAVADVDGDGYPEIFVGTSEFYYQYSPDHPTSGFRLFGVDHLGRDLPGWAGGKVTGGPVVTSPSLGDIDGDGRLEVVTLAMDKKLYAWNGDGTAVGGFPMLPRDHNGQANTPFNWIMGIALGDYDGDQKMEILFSQGWTVNIVDGNGHQLTGTNFPNNTLPIYYAGGLLLSTPAVGDLDNDGKLELVASGSAVTVWDLNASTDKASWPMFKRNAARTSTFGVPPRLSTSPSQLLLFFDRDRPARAQTTLTLNNEGDAPFTWSATVPDEVGVSPNSGTLGAHQAVVLSVYASTSGLRDGTYNLGDIVINATRNNAPVAGSPSRTSVRLVVGEISYQYLPAAVR